MSRTARISDEVYEAIEEYRSKDQSIQDVIEEMAEEFGLFPSDINNINDLEVRLESSYGYKKDEIRDVLNALRFVYIGQERPDSIGVPHKAGDRSYGDEIDALRRLDILKEEHYTGKYDYGYRTTRIGSELGSESVRNHISENEAELEQVLKSYDEALLGVILRFGFNKTDSDRLSDRGAVLARRSVPDFWDIPELLREYRSFKSDLENLGIAVQYNLDSGRTVLPPEFTDYIQNRIDSDDESVMAQIEVYQTLLGYTRGDLNTRKDVLQNMDLASESHFERIVEEFHNEGLTSEYISNQETPFLIKSSEEVEQRISDEIKELVGLSE